MSAYFFDSSALAKQYSPEVGTARVSSILAEPAGSFAISNLTVVEIRSSLAWKVRTGALSAEDFQTVYQRLTDDVADVPLQVVALADRHFSEAGGLIDRLGPARAIRTLDALQMAVAFELHAQGWLDSVVCADRKLASLMSDEGLTVINPEDP